MSWCTGFFLALLAGVELPAPSGPERVGTRLAHWIDGARPELGTADEWDPRELVVQLWYPADVPPGSTPAPYALLARAYRAQGLLDAEDARLVEELATHSTLAAPVSAAADRLPIVVLSTGNGEHAFAYTGLAEELASHGYLVAVLSHPGVADVAFPDGRVLRRYARLFDPKPAGWDKELGAASLALQRAVYDGYYAEAAEVLAGDVAFVLDELEREARTPGGPFTGRLDLARVATFGHSYGGNVAVEAAARDARVKACVSWDGGAFGPVRERGLAKPLLLVRPAFANDGTPRGVAQEQLFGSMRADAWEVDLAGAEHRSCIDAALTPAPAATLAPERALALTSVYARAFLQRAFEGGSGPLLARDAPEVFVRSLSFPAERVRALRGQPR